MVSGLVTSPCDHERIFSGLAKLMRIESKSAIWLARSYGLERYKGRSSCPDSAGTINHCNYDYKKLAAAPVQNRTGARGLIGRFSFFELRLLAFHQFDVQAQGLQFAHEDVKRFGHARLDAGFALHDRLVDFRAAIDVVGFRGEQFLQDVRRAVRFERPDFHFSEALPAELRLATERLLGDERIRADGACVNFVVNQVRELEHVDIADRDVLRELVARHAVVERDLSAFRQFGELQQVANVAFAGAVENRRCEGDALAEAVSHIEQRFVIEVNKRFPHGSGAKSVLEIFADGIGARFSVEQLGDSRAEFL